MRLRRGALSSLALVFASGAAAGEPQLWVWQLEGDRVLAEAEAPRAPLRVGSLQKPFVLQAWAAAHPAQSPPASFCSGGASCWLLRGHGDVDVSRATAHSCNAYFRALAQATPADLVARALRDAGFVVDGPLSADAAIGLAHDGEPAAVIRPADLLRSYDRLIQEPWRVGEALRQEMLAGLRLATVEGTASGLSGLGVYAKTGTASAVDGRPLHTSGFAIILDGAGSARLGLLARGTGREAARALAAAAQPRASGTSAASDRVRVALFSLLLPHRVVARNVSGVPLSARGGFVGPGGELPLLPGEQLAEGLWELRIDERRLSRRVKAAVEVAGQEDGRLRLIAEMDPMEYVAGVAAAELSSHERPRLRTLGAAVLRFLAGGPRHAFGDVCDSTHCAFFIGRGPRVAWSAPGRARVVHLRDGRGDAPLLDADLRAAIRAESKQPGPAFWTSHCGGRPLSARFLWGAGDAGTTLCPRHDVSSVRGWTRTWSIADAEAAFGPELRDLRVVSDDGVWKLRARTAAGDKDWLYDDAHRRLARVLGWGALPSPADAVNREADSFQVRGRGLGHRVGLCLAD